MSRVSIQPLGNYVYLRSRVVKETPGGIIIPEDKEYRRWFVEGVGCEVTRVEPGEEVLVNPAGTAIFPIEEGHQGCMVVKEEQVVAVISRSELVAL